MGGARRYLPEIVIALTLGAATLGTVVLYSLYGITPLLAIPWGVATLSSVSLFYAVRASGLDWQRELRLIFLIALVVALVSVFTGLGNGSTDEGRTTIAYGAELWNGHDPYTTFLVFQYHVSMAGLWQNTASSASYDTYLPLISFVQIPGTGPVGYELLCIAAWAGLVYLLRHDEFASLTLASPIVALVAANGYNDLPVLFLMTLSLRGWSGPKAKAVEYLTYGMKLFANAFWGVYYLLRKQWLSFGVMVALTLAIAAPFLLWHPTGIWCQALTLGWGPGCSPGEAGARSLNDLWDHWNYYLWLLWVYALFRAPIHAWIRRRRESSRRVPAGEETPTT